MWSWKLSISNLSDYFRTVFSVLSGGNEKLLKSLRVSRTVSQLIMRVHEPKVEYKLALQERPKGENLDVLLYKQFEIT